MLTDNERYSIMLHALEDIVGATSVLNIGLTSFIQASNIILRVDAIASSTLKRLERLERGL